MKDIHAAKRDIKRIKKFKFTLSTHFNNINWNENLYVNTREYHTLIWPIYFWSLQKLTNVEMQMLITHLNPFHVPPRFRNHVKLMHIIFWNCFKELENITTFWRAYNFVWIQGWKENWIKVSSTQFYKMPWLFNFFSLSSLYKKAYNVAMFP